MECLNTLATSEIDGNLIPIIAMGIGGLIAMVAITFGTIRRVSQTSAREKTKREIAAYVAEGSMTPEEGERLIKAGDAKEFGSCRSGAV
ncbi:MAG TPA: hypothetical protein ENK11_01250 [Phycisphaerales bacterium]|nr:hypothetical protein [Phycisphaerales bacterium]